MSKLSQTDSIEDEIEDEVGDEIAEEIGMSTSAVVNRKREITDSSSIPVAISGIETRKAAPRLENSKYTNSIIADSHIVSEIEITNPVRTVQQDSHVESETIMTASGLGSRSLQGRIVKSRAQGRKEGTKPASTERGSLEVLPEDDPDYITPAQLLREKRSFI